MAVSSLCSGRRRIQGGFVKGRGEACVLWLRALSTSSFVKGALNGEQLGREIVQSADVP